MKRTIGLAFVFIMILGPFAIFKYVYKSLPPSSGKVQLPGLSNSVTVIRDKWGVPHIEGNSEEDVHRALGYVMAGDRLFQMDLLRRVVNGQLSEIFGESTLKYDILLRKLRIRAHMDDLWETNQHRFDPQMIKLTKAFFEGVHTYIATHELPLEFQVLGYEPEPFKVQESFAISGYLALSFAEGLLSDALFSDLADELPQEVIDKMWVRDSSDKNYVQKRVSFDASSSSWYNDFVETHDFLRDHLGLFHGSNSWVLSGKRSTSGFPMLANDPHVAFSNPGIWYEAHLRSEDYEVYGHYVPLTPFPAMGHNRNRGWAVTMSEMDDLDLYEEKINALGQVMYKGEWRPVQTSQQIIKVRGADDQVIVVKETPHGPLLNGTQYGIDEKNIAVKWSYHHPENNVAQALYKLARTEKIEKLNHALRHAAAPGLNVSWADRHGNIGWKVMGKFPLRKGFRGNQILEGWSGKHEYERYFSIEENPGAINPENGIIVSANYRPRYEGDLPIDGYWQPSERYNRIESLLDAQFEWTLEELMEIQNDQTVANYKKIMNILLSELESESVLENEAKTYLENWEGQSDTKSVAASIYHMWISFILKDSIGDELGDKRFKSFNKVADSWHFFKSFLSESSSSLWNNIHTQENEGRVDIINKSFKSAISTLKERLGDDITSWQWGKIHTLEFEHPIGKQKPLNLIFNLGPYAVGGGPFQIDNMSHARYDNSFDVKLGPSVRRLIDFAEPQISYGVLPTGNSGHLLSSFYSDQVDLFINGRYREQWLDMESVTSHDHSVLKLVP